MADERGAKRSDDADLVEALRRGDRAAYAGLVDELTPALTRLALAHVPSRAVAEEVVQDTWIAILHGLPRFEGRSSLRTWMLRILTNRARSRGHLEARARGVASLDAEGDHEAAVESERFSDDPSSWPGHWKAHPRSWHGACSIPVSTN